MNRDILSKGLWRLALAASGYFLLQYLVLAGLRLGYPYELEWLEGVCMTHVLQLVHGKPLYGPPSVDFIPYLYTPLYFQVAAVFVKALGVHYASTRLLSFLCSLGIFALLYVWGRKESGRRGGGWLAMGFFAAQYRWAGAWLDTGRVDSLFLLFLLAGALRFRCSSRPAHDALAALLFLLAFMTKQTALTVGLGFALCALLIRPGLWPRLCFGLLFAGGVALYWTGMHLATDGWFTQYTYIMPRGHDLLWRKLPRVLVHDLLRHVPLLALATAAWCLGETRAKGFRGFLFAGCWIGTLLVITLLSRLRLGGYDNVLLPLALGGATSFAALLARDGGRKPWLSLAALAQFGLLAYNPIAQLPTRADRENGDAIVDYLRAIDGTVFLPQQALLAWQAGKGTYHSHETTFFDLASSTPDGSVHRLMEEALAEQRWDVIVLAQTRWFPHILPRWYRQIDPPFPVNEHFIPVTGAPSRPRYVYVKRTDPERGKPLRPPAP